MTPSAGPASRWFAFASLSMIYFVIAAGAFSSLGVALPAMITELHWDWQQAGWGYTVLGVACGVASLAPAVLIRRIGVRGTMAVGMVTMIAGFATMAMTHAVWSYLAATTMIGLAFSLVSTVPGSHVLTEVFKNRSTALGAYFAIGTLGSVAGPLIYVAVERATGGWRPYWWCYVGMSLVFGLFAIFSTPGRRDESAHQTEAPEQVGPAELIGGLKDWTVRRALMTPQFYVIVGVYTTYLLINTTAHAFAPGYLIDRGVDKADAALMLSLEALIGVGVSAVGGWLGERVSTKTLMMICLGAVAAGQFALAEARDWSLMGVFAVGVGVGYGLSFTPPTVLLLRYFGKKPNLELFSIMCLLSTIAAAGPAVGGEARVLTGSFEGLFLICGGVTMAMFLATAFLKPPALDGAVPAPVGAIVEVSETPTPIAADLLISGATLITMDGQRRVIEDASLAIAGDRIVAVGKRADLERTVVAKANLDGRRYVIMPGFVDGHIHITGDPLTRGFQRGAPEDSWGDKLQRWVIPIFRAQTAEDERLAAQCAALAMMRYGTTCFIEAGTVLHLDAVMDGLAESGIRGRVGAWVEGRAYDPAADQAKVSAEAIAILESEIERYPDDGGLLAAWPLLVGHSTNSDDVWRAAKALADEHGLRVSAHMSPRASDPEWFLTRYNRRPLEHLADIGVLGESVLLTHLANIDNAELDLLVSSGTGAIHCPHAALQGGFGVSRIGLFPEMLDRGVDLMLGTDGLAADVLSSGRLMASLFRDARCDQDLIPPTTILEMTTTNPARAMGMADTIGSLEVGKKADFVLHDTYLPEWGPIFDAVSQLALSAPPSGVHSVWIDGVQVIDAGRATLIDEDKILADARQAGRAVIARTQLPNRTPWPVS